MNGRRRIREGKKGYILVMERKGDREDLEKSCIGGGGEKADKGGDELYMKEGNQK